MKSRFLYKTLTVLVIAILFNAPVYATCTKQQCLVGGPACDQLLYDNDFVQGCWSFTGSAQILSSPYHHAYFTGSTTGNVYQEVSVPYGWTTHSLTIRLDNNSTGYSSARLYVEIRSTANVHLETVGAIATTDPDGRYDLPISNYEGQTIRINFRYVPGWSPGNGEFLLDNAYYFVY